MRFFNVAILLLVLSVSGPCECYSQMYTANHPNGLQSHVVVNTDLGIVTVDHAADGTYAERFPVRDVALNRNRLDGDVFVVGSGRPWRTFTRRGVARHLVIVDEDETRYYVKGQFYPGESGSPCLAKDGKIVGLVVGNAFIGDRWVGIVAKIAFLAEVEKKTLSIKTNRWRFNRLFR